MSSLPGALVVVDPKHEHNAISEAKKLGIATVCLADTDCDPDMIDICVPGNDDAIRAINLFLTRTADAVLAGKELPDDCRKSLIRMWKVKKSFHVLKDNVIRIHTNCKSDYYLKRTFHMDFHSLVNLYDCIMQYIKRQ